MSERTRKFVKFDTSKLSLPSTMLFQQPLPNLELRTHYNTVVLFICCKNNGGRCDQLSRCLGLAFVNLRSGVPIFFIGGGKVRLIQLLDYLSVASPESGLFSDWSRNKRSFSLACFDRSDRNPPITATSVTL